jgi:hypothetical protein
MGNLNLSMTAKSPERLAESRESLNAATSAGKRATRLDRIAFEEFRTAA